MTYTVRALNLFISLIKQKSKIGLILYDLPGFSTLWQTSFSRKARRARKVEKLISLRPLRALRDLLFYPMILKVYKMYSSIPL